jgi:hypothetical protein
MGYNSFEELDVWKRACRLAVRTYERLRNCRDYGLKGQMTRSAVSIASNIAEGAERNSRAEYIRFLHIAKGWPPNCARKFTLPSKSVFTKTLKPLNWLQN